MRFVLTILLVSLVGGCFAETALEDSSPFLGCYGSNEFAAKIETDNVWLSVPGQSFPAHFGKDKHGPYLLVERPIRYEHDGKGGLRLTAYKGSGTFFRLFGPPHATGLEIVVINGNFVFLPKVSCDAVDL